MPTPPAPPLNQPAPRPAARPNFWPRPMIFLHIPKAAGTTLQHVVTRQYAGGKGHRFTGAAEVLHEFRHVWTRQQRAAIDVYAGHVHYGVHVYLDEPATYVTMLRDPVERIVSHYHHVLRNPQHYLYKLVAGPGLSLHDYVEKRVTYETDNDQVRWLLPYEHIDIPKGGVTRMMLDEAKHNLSRIAVAGLAERFDESLLLIQHACRFKDVTYVHRNVNADRPALDDVPRETLELIRDTNRLDIELYEHARARFDAEIRALGPDFPARLEAFRRMPPSAAALTETKPRAESQPATPRTTVPAQ